MRKYFYSNDAEKDMNAAFHKYYIQITKSMVQIKTRWSFSNRDEVFSNTPLCHLQRCIYGRVYDSHHDVHTILQKKMYH